jgi:hypothetical protein
LLDIASHDPRTKGIYRAFVYNENSAQVGLTISD